MAREKAKNLIQKKIAQSLDILETLGLPKQQRNERSALTLLSLLNLKPDSAWADAQEPLIGITPMMEFFAEHYNKHYAPNTRETVRRQTVHQFLQAGLIILNPDNPSRPVNSPKAAYQIEPSALDLLKQYGKPGWTKKAAKYISNTETLRKKYARERKMLRIPIKLLNGKKIQLSPGGQNVLVKKIIDDFCSLYTPGARIIYVGDTKRKWAYFDKTALTKLGVDIEEHGKMVDVVVYHTTKNWLVLIEAVTSHGPINPKRRMELQKLFGKSKAGIVYVTAFLNRSTMIKYLAEISWETEVWIADSPTHLIHFNGERFLGPYDD